jgi:hypothetical protein
MGAVGVLDRHMSSTAGLLVPTLGAAAQRHCRNCAEVLNTFSG